MTQHEVPALTETERMRVLLRTVRRALLMIVKGLDTYLGE